MEFVIDKATRKSRDQGELILMQMTTGKFYGLDRLGSEVWTMLEEGLTIVQMTEFISGSYSGVEKEQIERDVNDLIVLLIDARLIKKVN